MRGGLAKKTWKRLYSTASEFQKQIINESQRWHICPLFRLIPNSLMLFSADEVSKPVEADLNYLKEELLMLVQDM